MRIKNISSTKIELPEFKLSLDPGDMGDLSEYDPKQLHTHKRLNSYFSKGLLINLGNSSPPGSTAALKSARNQIERLGLSGYVAKPAKKSSIRQQNNRSKIDALLSNSRKAGKSGFDSDKERYSDEYYANMNPTQPREEHTQPKPRPQVDEKFRNMQIEPDGTVTEFGAYGVIETGVLTNEKNLLIPEKPTKPSKKDQPKLEVQDKEGNTYSVSLENIQDRLKRHCIGFTNSRKPCKKWAVHGFQSCLTHLSESEKKEYEKLKKNPT